MIKKRKIVFITLVILFLILASNIQAKTVKQNCDHEIETKENKETTNTGCVYGRVLDWNDEYTGLWPLPFANVKTEYKSTRCNLKGYYKLSGLPLNIEFKIIVSYPRRYDSIKNIILTEEKPVWELDFFLFFKSKNDIGNIFGERIDADELPACIGLVEGRVGNSHGLYYWEPYIFALVDAEVKQTRTGLLGWYRMFLSLNKEYQLIAYKSGFKPLTKKVTLTDQVPVQEINFDFF